MLNHRTILTKATQKVSGFWFLRADKIDPHARILFLFLKVKGHIIVSHACRLGTGGSILNLRCFPNSKTADSFTERNDLDFPTEQTMGWPTSSDGRMRGPLSAQNHLRQTGRLPAA